ncbi:MAG TPA: DsbE family thiol:disulfide interchange protein [Burkholderiales bacterium]|nr:DsbE family thiol:disulfide interchange protein [Burkholderiales bacterium]
MTRFLLPLGVFVLLVGFLAAGLKLRPSEVPSPLIGKPAPAFELPRLQQPQQMWSPTDAQGKVWLLNVWASWCVSCRDEHPLLLKLAQSGVAPIYGLNYKDKRQDALNWLDKFGNPYVLSVLDLEGRVGIDYGVYGVPETYVIDDKGIIRYKHIGPLTADAVERTILPLVKKLNGSA